MSDEFTESREDKPGDAANGEAGHKEPNPPVDREGSTRK